MRALNQTGQMTIEMILILTILLGVAVSATGYIKNQKLLGAFVEGPWAATQGMIEDGVWQPASTSKAANPANFSRVRSSKGDGVPPG